jgi:hypothetical protein
VCALAYTKKYWRGCMSANFRVIFCFYVFVELWQTVDRVFFMWPPICNIPNCKISLHGDMKNTKQKIRPKPPEVAVEPKSPAKSVLLSMRKALRLFVCIQFTSLILQLWESVQRFFHRDLLLWSLGNARSPKLLRPPEP